MGILGIDDLLDENKVREAQSETQEVVVEEKTETPKPKEEVVIDEAKPEVKTDAPKIDNPPLELNEETVKNYINSQREKDENFFSDYFQPEKEVEKIVNPYEGVFDDNDNKYFEFKKETGLGRKEFDFVQQDFSTKSPLDLAIERVKRGTDIPLTTDQARSYLENKLDIDLSEEGLDKNAEISLSEYAKPLKDELISQQEKYRTTVLEKPAPIEKGEMVKLENGEEMPKAKYDQLVKQNQEYIKNLKEGVSSATSFDVDISFDSNGEKQTAKFNYDYSEDDKHSMLSNASDLTAFINQEFRTEKGVDLKGLAEFIHRGKNTDKLVALAYNQGRAEMLEEKVASDNNEQFGKAPKPLNKTESDNVDSLLKHY